MRSETDEDSGEEAERDFTLEDLEKVQAQFENLRERDSQDTSGNLNKYHTRINQCRLEMDHIREQLKLAGKIPYSNEELLNKAIDDKFPKSRSKDIVEFDGKKFVLQFSPKTKSRSGKTVTSWYRGWKKLT